MSDDTRIIPAIGETRIIVNSDNEIEIEQDTLSGDTQIIVIPIAYLETLIDHLCDLAGIGPARAT